MLRQRILIFEYIIGLYFLLQIIFPSQFSISSSLVGFILLSFTKYQFEGFRITFIIFLLIQLILLFVNSIYLAIPITVLVYLAITYFPIYKYPVPTGKYRVGYKMITVKGHKESTTVGVYYPTTEKTKDVKYSPSHKAWERFADIMRLYADYEKKFLIPKIVFKLMLSFLEYQYLGVNKDASIAKIEGNTEGGYPVIMFSHGLSANIHIYSILLKEWASHGFVVFSVDHEDEIHVDITGFKVFADYLRIRNGQLSLRKSLVKSVLDKVCDRKFVQDLFEDSSVTLNYNQLFATGHSFGGVTAAEVSAEDKRITGGMVLLDPWYECANLDVIYKETNLPLLSVRSSDYDKPGDLRTRIVTHVEKSNAIKGRTVSGMVEKAGHNASTDLLILMPREMAVLGDLRLDMIEEHIRTHYMLTRVFLTSVLQYSKGKETGDLRSFVMENYKIEQAKTGKKDIFVVD